MVFFTLTTDASNYSIAGTLTEMQDDFLAIIAVYSQVLTDGQMKWAISHLELLAIYTFLRKWEKYLITERFMIRTDNISVAFTLQNISKHDITGHNPASRYLIYISTFDYKCVHTSGRNVSFMLTDLLSRKVVHHTTP